MIFCVSILTATPHTKFPRQDITFEVASGGANVEIVSWDGSTLTIKGLEDGPIRIVAKSEETGAVLGSFSGKVLGADATDDEIFQNQWGDPTIANPPPAPSGTKIWKPKPLVQGGDITAPEGGEKTVRPGESVALRITAATDEDTWVMRQGNITTSGTEPEDVFYFWTDQDGETAQNENDRDGNPGNSDSLSVNLEDHTKAGWKAPTEEGTYTITCTLVDANTHVSSGSRDDNDVVRTFNIKVEEKKPDIDTGDEIRACAGHIDNIGNGVHKATIHLIAKDEETGDPVAAKLYLSFEGNKGSEDAKRAKFYLGPNLEDQVEETTVTTNADTGKANITVISSDVISNSIKVKVEWKDAQDNYKDVGSVTCDFGAVEGKRRFGIKPFADDTLEGADKDNGWTAMVEYSPSPNFFTGPGQVCAMTVYTKFRKDLSIPVDTQYFKADGTPNDQNLTDKDNWLAVPGHQLRVSFAGIGKRASIHSAYAARDDSPLYVYFVDSAGYLIDKDGNELHDAQGNPVGSPSKLSNYQPPDFVNVTTGGNGTATVYVKSGPLINNVVYFALKAEDQTQRQQ